MRNEGLYIYPVQGCPFIRDMTFHISCLFIINNYLLVIYIYLYLHIYMYLCLLQTIEAYTKSSTKYTRTPDIPWKPQRGENQRTRAFLLRLLRNFYSKNNLEISHRKFWAELSSPQPLYDPAISTLLDVAV
jgi:hypothetical protein